eukprot:COSAG02_NODE_53719_length_300_cov_0.711443_1_plen_45_part_01
MRDRDPIMINTLVNPAARPWEVFLSVKSWYDNCVVSAVRSKATVR